MDPTVILLNGVGSVGKSSIARALQTLTRAPYLHVPMDSFFDMLPGRLIDTPDGVEFVRVGGDGPPEIAIRSGPAAAKLFSAIPASVAALAAAGNNLIVDDVILGDRLAAYDRHFATFRFLKVGLHAPLDVLEAREAARGDRRIGLARWQFSRVHAGKTYDLEIDTAGHSPEDWARQICAAFRL